MECFEETNISFKPLPEVYFEVGIFYKGGVIGKNNSSYFYTNSYIGGLPLESDNKCTHVGIPCCVSTYFNPGGFSNLIGIPSSEISDPIELEPVFGKQGKELVEKIKYAVNINERIKILDSFYLKFLEKRNNQLNLFYIHLIRYYLITYSVNILIV